jgi:hypothetical protein
MADQNGTASIKEGVETPVELKGKGKAAAEPENHDVSMDGDDSSSEEELDEVCHTEHKNTMPKLINVIGCANW